MKFEKSDIFTVESKVTLWGKRDINVGIDLPCFDDSELDEQLQKYSPMIEEKIKWIESNRKIIEKALIEDDMVELAEEWASSAEMAEDENEECYLMENGDKVFLPISESDFLNSLQINGINMQFDDEEEEDNFFEIFLECHPDYFACHVIDVYVDYENNVTCNGLAG